MRAILVVFLATLAYAAIDLLRRRHRALRSRASEAGKAEPRPVPRRPELPPGWFDGARLEGGFVVGKLLGSGALGDVHVVEHHALERRWAAKVVRRDLIPTAAHRRALLNELAHGFRLAGHPHIVRTEMFRSFGDDLAIFSEIVENGTLAAALPGSRFASLDSVRVVALQLASALEAIHLAERVHGDVKPSNILLTRSGVAKLADLGLASLRQFSDSRRPGTLLYRSPEQARREPVTPASDVWGWAVTVIAMLLGGQPTHAGGELAAHTLRSLRGTARIVPDDELYRLLEACLQRKPTQRITIRALIDQLCHGDRPSVPRTPHAPHPAARSAQIADELAAHDEALRQLLADLVHGAPEIHDATLCEALAKSDCHRRHGDLAGAAATLDGALRAAVTASPGLVAGAWLELGSVHHDRGMPAAAIHAFEQAAARSADMLVRARAHHGAAAAAWTTSHREGAHAHARKAVVLAAHALDVSTIDPTEAQQVHAAALITLAEILREFGDVEGHESCIAHAITVCEQLDDASRQTLVRGLLQRGDFTRARERLGLLGKHTRAPATTVLAASIDLEEARARVIANQLPAAATCARRARDLLRPLAEQGISFAVLPLAVAEVYLAWALDALRGPANIQIERALLTLDDAARNGRHDAAALATWVRQQRAAERPRVNGASRAPP